MINHDNKEELNSLLWDLAAKNENGEPEESEELRELAAHIEECGECRNYTVECHES